MRRQAKTRCVRPIVTDRPDQPGDMFDSHTYPKGGLVLHMLRQHRDALVISEVALAVVLLVGAGLFIGRFARLTRVDPASTTGVCWSRASLARVRT